MCFSDVFLSSPAPLPNHPGFSPALWGVWGSGIFHGIIGVLLGLTGILWFGGAFVLNIGKGELWKGNIRRKSNGFGGRYANIYI